MLSDQCADDLIEGLGLTGLVVESGALANEIFDRAIARGEPRADLDREAALDLTMSALYWRVVVRRRTLQAEDLDRFATAITAALTTL